MWVKRVGRAIWHVGFSPTPVVSLRCGEPTFRARKRLYAPQQVARLFDCLVGTASRLVESYGIVRLSALAVVRLIAVERSRLPDRDVARLTSVGGLRSGL